MVIKFNGFIYDLTEKDAIECLQKEINNMYADHEKLRSAENLEIITENILLKKLQNQKAIECLREVKENCEKVGKFGFLTILIDEEFDETYIGEYVDYSRIKEIIDTRIKELEGEKE